ncbi:AGAP010658-PA, partial [Anopheles gambiae str. PEST]
MQRPGCWVVVLGTVLSFCHGTYVPITQAKVDGLPVKYADKEFLVKQKFFFEILRHLHQPIAFEEYLPYTSRWVTDPSKYTNYTEVAEFIQTYEQGVLKKGQIFTIYNYWYAKETVQLYRFFENAIDWDTYYKNVVWARANLNEGMFLSALTLSVLHRKDLQGIVLPAIYEIHPHLFFDGDVFQDATNKRALDPNYGFYANKRNNLALANYTAWFATQF